MLITGQTGQHSSSGGPAGGCIGTAVAQLESTNAICDAFVSQHTLDGVGIRQHGGSSTQRGDD